MAIFPRPVSPKSAFADLKDFITEARPHKLPLLILSITLTSVIVWAFVHDSRSPKREREIIYVENWMADRKDSAILTEQKRDLALYERALEDKQREFQNVADTFGVEWRKDAAKNRADRVAIIAAVNKRLDQKIVEARRREGDAERTDAAKPGS